MTNTNDKVRTPAEIKQRLKELDKLIKNTSGAKFDLLQEESDLLQALKNCPVDFTEFVSSKSKTDVVGNANNRSALDSEQLIKEVDKLIDQNLPQSQLDVLLPLLASMSGMHILDVKALYSSRLIELEQDDSKEDLQKDLDSLLAMGGESLDLHEFLPDPLAKPLIKLASRMGIRPEVFLLTLLTGISTLHKVGTHLIMNFEDKFVVPPNLFAGIVGDSGQKKSPVMRVLIQNPLDALEEEANESLKLQHEEEIAEYRNLSEEERDELFPDGKPEPKVPIDYYFSDGTVEGINRQFERQPERGLLYLRDELSGLFNSYDKYRNGKGSDRQDFLSFFDGSGKKELRAEGFVSRVKKTQLSIFGTVQSDTLRHLMKDPNDADGQWARFLFVIQPLQAAQPNDSSNYDINSELINPLYRKIDQLPKTTYNLSPAAKKVYDPHYKMLEQLRVSDSEPAMRAMYAKMEGMIGRLALNLHIIHEAFGDSGISQAIPAQRIYEACKLAKFFIQQIRLIHATARATEGEIAPNLAAIVDRSRKVGAVTARDVQKSVRAFKDSGVSVQEIRCNFRQLEEMGYGECIGEGSKMGFLANDRTEESYRKLTFAQNVNIENHHCQNGSNLASQMNLDQSNYRSESHADPLEFLDDEKT